MEKLTTKDKRFNLPTWYKPVLVALIVVVIGGFLFFSGWSNYVAAYIKCGGKRPYIASSFFTKTYTSPDSIHYSAPVPPYTLGFSGYYCSEAEVKAAGFL